MVALSTEAAHEERIQPRHGARMRGADGAHADDLAVEELHAIVLGEHPASPMRWYSSIVKRRRGMRTATVSVLERGTIAALTTNAALPENRAQGVRSG